MVCTSRANLLSGRARHVHHSPQASVARRTGHRWYSRHPSATSTVSFLHKTFYWRPFVIVALYFVNALTHESFTFQGRTTTPEIHVWSNSCPNWTEKKTWSASLPQQFGEGKAFYVFFKCKLEGRFPFVWKNRSFRWEIKWNGPFHWKFFGKKGIPSEVFLFSHRNNRFFQTNGKRPRWTVNIVPRLSPFSFALTKG